MRASLRSVCGLLLALLACGVPRGAAAALELRVVRPPAMPPVLAADQCGGTAGRATDYPLRVTVVGSDGAPVAGVEVQFQALGDAAGRWPGTVTAVSGADGVAAVRPTLGPRPGQFFVRATATGVDQPVLWEVTSRPRTWVVRLLIGMLGGIGLFIFGLDQMSTALQRAAGDRLRTWLRRLTPNPYLAALVGAGLTAAMQSSSVTTVMVIGLVQAEVMTLTQAVGVIFGANIGTTFTTQIIAFRFEHFGLLFVAGGVPLLFASRRERVRQAGAVLLGFGLLFFGMELMGGAMRPLRTLPSFLNALASLSRPVLAIAVGAAVTAVFQSSAAVTGIVIVIASQGILPLETAIGVVLGTNIGTCVTVGIAAVGKSREAVRAALAHLLFNLAGVMVMMWLIPWFAEVVRWLSLAHGAGATVPRQVANAHTLFNLTVAAVLLPVAGPFAALLRRLVPDREEEPLFRVRYLDDAFLDSPPQALAAVRQEARRMGATIDVMLERIPGALFHGDTEAMRDIAAQDDLIDFLDGAIIDYLRLISARHLGPEQAAQMLDAIRVINEIEHIGDVIEVDVGHLVHRSRSRPAGFAPAGQDEIVHLTDTVRRLVAQAVASFTTEDASLAAAVLDEKGEVQGMEEASRRAHLQRMQQQLAPSLVTHALHLDALNCLQRIGHHARNIARVVQEQVTGERREAPLLWVAAAQLTDEDRQTVHREP
jgi:phosphate:Na+ symporter